MPRRNSVSEPAMSAAVRAASPGITGPSTATKLPKPANTASTMITVPMAMQALGSSRCRGPVGCQLSSARTLRHAKCCDARLSCRQPGFTAVSCYFSITSFNNVKARIPVPMQTAHRPDSISAMPQRRAQRMRSS